MKPLRVAFVGTSGTGKSTLSRYVSERIGIPHIEEQARVVSSDMGTTLRDMRYRDPYLFQRKVLEYQFQRERDLSETGFISDRSVFDPLVYLMRFTDPTPMLVSRYRSIIFTYYSDNPYTHIFYLRPGEFDPPDDGVRSLDRLYRYQVDGMFLMLLNSYSIPYRIITGTVDERYRKVKGIIESSREQDTRSLFDNQPREEEEYYRKYAPRWE